MDYIQEYYGKDKKFTIINPNSSHEISIDFPPTVSSLKAI